jgi:hypothetical protein
MIANLSIPVLPPVTSRLLSWGYDGSPRKDGSDNVNCVPLVRNQKVRQFGVDALTPRVAAPKTPDNQNFLITVDVSIFSNATVVSLQLGLTVRAGYLLHPRDYKRPSVFSSTA